MTTTPNALRNTGASLLLSDEALWTLSNNEHTIKLTNIAMEKWRDFMRGETEIQDVLDVGLGTSRKPLGNRKVPTCFEVFSTSNSNP